MPLASFFVLVFGVRCCNVVFCGGPFCTLLSFCYLVCGRQSPSRTVGAETRLCSASISVSIGAATWQSSRAYWCICRCATQSTWDDLGVLGGSPSPFHLPFTPKFLLSIIYVFFAYLAYVLFRTPHQCCVCADVSLAFIVCLSDWGYNTPWVPFFFDWEAHTWSL